MMKPGSAFLAVLLPSSHDLVSHATVRIRADVLFGVKAIWESGIDLARLVECLYLFRRERKLEARKWSEPLE
jgi:hypothetical protein